MKTLLADPADVIMGCPSEMGDPLTVAGASLFANVVTAAAVDSISYLLRNLFDKIIPPTDTAATAAASSVIARLSALESEVTQLKRSTVKLY